MSGATALSIGPFLLPPNGVSRSGVKEKRMPDTPAPEEGVEGQPAPEVSPPSEPSLEDVKPPEEPEGRTVDQLAAEMHRKDEERNERLDRIENLLVQGQQTTQQQVHVGTQNQTGDPSRPFSHYTDQQLRSFRADPPSEYDHPGIRTQADEEWELRIENRAVAKAEARIVASAVPGRIKTDFGKFLGDSNPEFAKEVEAVRKEWDADPDRAFAELGYHINDVALGRLLRRGAITPSNVDKWKGEIRGDMPHMEGVPPSASRPPEGGLTPEHEKISKNTYGQDPKKVAELQKQFEAEGRLAP